MTRLDAILRNYESFVALPWQKGLAGSLRVWFVVYDKNDERRLRYRVEEFELAAKKSNHGWMQLDLTNIFAEWLAENEYRESYFSDPNDIDMALNEFQDNVCDRIQTVLHQEAAGENCVVALIGVASLFGLTRVSSIIHHIEKDIRGRLLVFFPGTYENGNYRLLDARDGWNYRAVPITANKWGE